MKYSHILKILKESSLLINRTIANTLIRCRLGKRCSILLAVISLQSESNFIILSIGLTE